VNVAHSVLVNLKENFFAAQHSCARGTGMAWNAACLLCTCCRFRQYSAQASGSVTS